MTLESRSPHHALSIVVEPGEGGQMQCDARVTDLDTNEVLANPHLNAPTGRPVESNVDLRDLHIMVRIIATAERFIADVEIEQGDMLIDSINSSWALKPQRAHLRAPGAMRVGGDVRPPRLLHKVEPQYTDEARRARVSGIVIVEALIDRSGVVRDAMALKPLPFGLAESAIAAVKQWLFEPGTLNGQPVDVIFNVTVNFKIDGSRTPAPEEVSAPPPPPPPPGC
jgi:TonB family protein